MAAPPPLANSRARHAFTAKLLLDKARMTYVDVPAAVSRLLGRQVPIPPDLREALHDAGALDAWESMPPGKREHILAWVEAAVHEATREKRIARSVEEALRRHEMGLDHPKHRPSPRHV